MKKIVKPIIWFCCVMLLVSLFSVASFAQTVGLQKTDVADGDPPLISGYVWETLGAAEKTEQRATYFVITAKAGAHTEQLYISLPVEGGFRLQSKHEYQQTVEVSNVGLFEPSAVATIEYKKDASGAVIMTGADGTLVRYISSAKGFELQVCNKSGKKIVGITNTQIHFGYKKNGDIVRTLVEMPLVEREAIYQGGERFNDTNQVGHYTSLGNKDSHSHDQYGYVNVPIFHSNRCYSIWFNMTYYGEADIGANLTDRYRVLFDGDKLDFYMWAGTPLENIKKYTALTGTSGMTEEWTFGFWAGAMTTAFNNTGKMNAFENMVDMLEGFKERYGFYPESLYGEGENSSNALNLQYQVARGVRSTFWFFPQSEVVDYLPTVSMYPTKDENGNIISAGWPYPWNRYLLSKDQYDFVGQWYDFSNPHAADVITGRMQQLWKWGVSGAMIDYGEFFPYEATYYNGLSGAEMHNLNSYYYAKSAQSAWQAYHGNDYVLYMRSGVAGSQYYTGNFLGDQDTNWDGYMDQIYAMVSMGASGYNLYGGDLGGLNRRAGFSNNLYNRWTVLAAFSPWMRAHAPYIRHPWDQGETAAKNFGKYYYFRKNIVPTVMSAAMDANQTSNPIVKGMMVAYPYQLGLADVNDQYLFCDDFLVCPVTTENTHYEQVSLPNGNTWYSLFTYEKFTGGQSIDAQAPTAFMPVFVKAGAVKAINLPESLKLADMMLDDDPAEYAPHASLLITPPDAERETTIYVKDGESEDYQNYDYHTEVYTSKPVNNATFTVTNEEKSPRNTVLALGVTAAEVLYDGTPLTRLDHIPDYYTCEYGYHVDLNGLTTIYLPENWKTLTIVKGNAAYIPYEMTGNYASVNFMLDDSVRSAYMITAGNNANVEISMASGEAVPVGDIVLKWTTGFWSEYDIEYTTDGENWQLLTEHEEDMHTVTNGAGSFDVINASGASVYALRLSCIKKGDETANPGLYSVEVYPPQETILLGEDGTPLPEYPEDENPFDDLDFEDEFTGTTPEDDGGWVKRIISYYLPWWAILLIVLGGIVVVGGILLWILLARKKKKEAEAALAAQEAPIDFPSPLEEE